MNEYLIYQNDYGVDHYLLNGQDPEDAYRAILDDRKDGYDDTYAIHIGVESDKIVFVNTVSLPEHEDVVHGTEADMMWQNFAKRYPHEWIEGKSE